MVSSEVKTAEGDKPPEDYSCDGSPLPAEPRSNANGPNLPVSSQKASGGNKAKNSCQNGGYKITPKETLSRRILIALISLGFLGETV